MWTEILDFGRALVAHRHRVALVERMRRMDDHLLQDIGIRRDQLDSLLLDAHATPAKAARASSLTLAVRPSLQGCG